MSIEVLLVRLLRAHPVVQRACQPASISGASVALPALAPLWHTRALVLLMLVVAATGTALQTRAVPAHDTATQLTGSYLPLLLVNVGLSIYVSRVGLGRSIYRELFGVGRRATGGALGDMACAAALTAGLLGAEKALQILPGSGVGVAGHALVPGSQVARVYWLGLAPIIGLSEELVYRGYLQRQLTALTGQPWLGIALQALLFGIAHGEQGGSAVARFAVYGLSLGGVAHARRTILPCVLCHVALDLAAGLGG
jgi:membrane protease YdiL (CAAX protease family)